MPCPKFLLPAEWIRSVGCWCLSGYKLWCFCVTMANFISSITVDEYSIKQPSIIVQPSGTVCYLCCWLVDIKAFGIFLYFSCPSYNFFCVVVADFICCNSHWIVYQATFDHGPTIGDSLFICLLLVNLWHLEFSYISADRMTPENWLTVDWSIRQFWQIGWWRTDHIWIMLNIYSLSTCGQADDAMLDTFFVSKLKQWCILTGDGLAIAKLFM